MWRSVWLLKVFLQFLICQDAFAQSGPRLLFAEGAMFQPASQFPHQSYSLFLEWPLLVGERGVRVGTLWRPKFRSVGFEDSEQGFALSWFKKVPLVFEVPVFFSLGLAQVRGQVREVFSGELRVYRLNGVIWSVGPRMQLSEHVELLVEMNALITSESARTFSSKVVWPFYFFSAGFSFSLSG